MKEEERKGSIVNQDLPLSCHTSYFSSDGHLIMTQLFLGCCRHVSDSATFVFSMKCSLCFVTDNACIMSPFLLGIWVSILMFNATGIYELLCWVYTLGLIPLSSSSRHYGTVVQRPMALSLTSYFFPRLYSRSLYSFTLHFCFFFETQLWIFHFKSVVVGCRKEKCSLASLS